MTSFRMDSGGARNPALCPKSAGKPGGVSMGEEHVRGNCYLTPGGNARAWDGVGGLFEAVLNLCEAFHDPLQSCVRGGSA